MATTTTINEPRNPREVFIVFPPSKNILCIQSPAVHPHRIATTVYAVKLLERVS